MIFPKCSGVAAIRIVRAEPDVRFGIVRAAGLAILSVLLGLGCGARDERPPALALAEARTVEVRFTSPFFDRHRLYRVSRGGPQHETVSMAALIELERAGDRLAVASGQALAGEIHRARALLEDLPASPARDSDRAAIALLAGDAHEALRSADAALAVAPDLMPAHWNRALALQALDLPLAAAQELDAVVARGEPGWSTEAAVRSTALRGPVEQRQRDYEAFDQAGAAMVTGTGPVLGVELVRRHPGPARIFFFDALRASATAAEIDVLRSVAAELDHVAGTNHATSALERVAHTRVDVRRQFQARYRALFANTLDSAAAVALIADLSRAGADVDDIRLGAIVIAGRVADELPAVEHLVADTGDPWFRLMLDREKANIEIRAGNVVGGERRLIDASAACEHPRWAHRCGQLDMDLSKLYLRFSATHAAEARARAAHAAFAASGEVELENATLSHLAQLEELRDRPHLVQAYLAELDLRSAKKCEFGDFADEIRASVALDRSDLDGARRWLADLRCRDRPPRWNRVATAVDLARLGDDRDRARAAAGIAAIRAAGQHTAIMDVNEGRLIIDRDPERGAALLRAGLASLAREPVQTSVVRDQRSLAFTTLIDAAGRRGDWASALALVEEETAPAVRDGCLVAAMTDDARAVAIVRGADGRLRGAYQTGRPLDRFDPATVVPPELAAALRGCDEIAVLARPPLHGRSALLPAELPWFFAGPARVPPPAAGSPRRVLVTEVRAPTSLGLPLLAGVPVIEGAITLTGGDATPSRLMAELRDATYVEIHAHGIVDPGESETAFLALSPEPGGRFALTAADLRGVVLGGAPVVVVAACRTATVVPSRFRRWSLPDAFLAGGARAVVAAAVDIPDDQGAALFLDLRHRMERGESPVRAIAALRADRVAARQGWAAGLLVFQ